MFILVFFLNDFNGVHCSGTGGGTAISIRYNCFKANFTAGLPFFFFNYISRSKESMEDGIGLKKKRF